MSLKPHATFIVAGDFNSPQQPLEHFYSLLDENVDTFRRSQKRKLL